MRNINTYIAIDQASTSGIAYYVDGIINYFQIKAEPVVVFDTIKTIAKQYGINNICFESFVYFSRSRKTQLNLIMLIGYLKHSLVNEGFNVEFAAPLTVRKAIGFSGKNNNKKTVFSHFEKMGVKTDNEADAIAILMYKLGKTINDNIILQHTTF